MHSIRHAGHDKPFLYVAGTFERAYKLATAVWDALNTLPFEHGEGEAWEGWALKEGLNVNLGAGLEIWADPPTNPECPRYDADAKPVFIFRINYTTHER